MFPQKRKEENPYANPHFSIFLKFFMEKLFEISCFSSISEKNKEIMDLHDRVEEDLYWDFEERRNK